MAYKTYTTASVTTLLNQHKTLHEALQKAFMKKEPQKNVDAKALEIRLLLKKDIDGIRENFNLHLNKTEKTKAASDQAVVSAKEALGQFQKAQATDVQVIRSRALPKIMAALNTCTIAYEEAHEDADAYGKSWFQYRSLGMEYSKIDTKWTADFVKMRNGLMVEGKPLTLKIEQMKQNAILVQAIVKQAQAVQGIVARDAEAQAQEMENKLTQLLQDMRENNGTGKKAFDKNLESLNKALNNKSLTGDISPYEGLYKNMINCFNTWKVKLVSMETTFKSFKSGLANVEDQKVKTSLSKAETLVKEAGILSKMGQVGIQHAAEVLQLLRKKLVVQN